MPTASKYGTLDSGAMEEEAISADDPQLSPPTRGSIVVQAALGIGLAAALVGFAYEAAPPSTRPRASLVEVNTAASASAAASAGGRPAAEADAELDALSFEASNFYHVRDGKPAQDYPWLKGVKLIEPHRETILSVSSPRDGHEYVWEVRGEGEKADDLRATASGAETTMILTELNENMITVKEVDPAGDVVRQLQERVMVKYVRREIRTLTDEEREELFDAMYQLWEAKVDGGNGKELYGNDYADIWEINRLHFKAAMNKTCDHFHDGMGFLTSHSMLTNTFEYSLQLVNPKLTLPYWDWTIEELDAERESVDGEIVIKSPLFQESWFGTADPDDYVVKDSRWAYTKVPSMYDGNPGDLIPDVYGRLRSRWNVNSSPYITRGLGQHCDTLITERYPWPTCALHLEMVTDYHDWYSWVCDCQHAPHGYVHVWIGGMLNCDDTLSTLTDLVGRENAESIKISAMNRKNYWQMGMFECKGSANADTPVEELFSSGQCGCLEYDLTEGDDWLTIYDSQGFDDIIPEYDNSTKRAVIRAVCGSTNFLGEHIGAGSPPDPAFWPMHPTMERLFMFSVLTGQITDWTWPDDDSASFNISNYDSSTCVGHGGSDVFPFGMLDTDTDGFQVKTGIAGNPKLGNNLTNREILAALNAKVNMLPYVYDTFKWPHCLEAGVDFDDAWGTASSTAAAGKSENIM